MYTSYDSVRAKGFPLMYTFKWMKLYFKSVVDLRDKNEKECIAELLKSHQNQAAKVDNETRQKFNSLHEKVRIDPI